VPRSCLKLSRVSSDVEFVSLPSLAQETFDRCLSIFRILTAGSSVQHDENGIIAGNLSIRVHSGSGTALLAEFCLLAMIPEDSFR
jgi:hypothetical protein